MIDNNFIGKRGTKNFVVPPGEKIELYSDGQYEIIYSRTGVSGSSMGVFYGQYTSPPVDLAYTRNFYVISYSDEIFWDVGVTPYVMKMREFVPNIFSKKDITVTGSTYNIDIVDIINGELSFSIPANTLVSFNLPNATQLKGSGLFEKRGRFYDFFIINKTLGASSDDGIIMVANTTPGPDGSCSILGSNRVYPRGVDGSVAAYSVGLLNPLLGLDNYIYLRKS